MSSEEPRKKEEFYLPKNAVGVATLIMLLISIIMIAGFVTMVFIHPALDLVFIVVMVLIIYFASTWYYKKYIGE